MHTSMLHSTGVWCLQAHVEHKFAWTSYIASGTIRMSICMLSSTCAARRIAHQHLKMPTYFKKRPFSATKVYCGLSQLCEPWFHNTFQLCWRCWTRCGLRATYNFILFLHLLDSYWTHAGLTSASRWTDFDLLPLIASTTHWMTVGLTLDSASPVFHNILADWIHVGLTLDSR